MSNTTEVRSEKAKQNILYLVLAILIVLIIYVIFQVLNYINKPNSYVLAQNGRITSYEDVVAYVIRNEQVIDTSEYKGKREEVIVDSNRVSKNGVIANYINDNSKHIDEQIEIIDNELQKLLENTTIDRSQEIKNSDKKIEELLYKITNKKNNVNDLKSYKLEISNELEKKASQIGKSSKDQKINSLISERISLEKEQKKSKQELKAEKAGLVSYRVDGYEEELNENSFSKISIDKLSKIKYVTNQAIPINEEKVKLINNFYTYLAVVASSEESRSLKLNDTIKYALNGDLTKLYKGSVQYIAREDDDRILIIFKTTNNVEKLSRFRKINIDLIWWDYEGIKVPNDAIHEKNVFDSITIERADTSGDSGESGEALNQENTINTNQMIKNVKVLGVTGYPREVLVKVINSAGGYSIIENYKDQELLDMGLPESYVNSRSRFNLYDKIIVEN